MLYLRYIVNEKLLGYEMSLSILKFPVKFNDRDRACEPHIKVKLGMHRASQICQVWLSF